MKIAVVGRANVGKSTIINILAGKKFNITKDIAGVTRNRKEIMAKILGINVILIDTAGLEHVSGKIEAVKNHDINNAKFELEMHKQMFLQATIAIKQADVILFCVDACTGLLEQDFFFADFVRKQNKKTLLLVNKAEKQREIKISQKDSQKLGFGEGFLVSAEHNIGIADVKTEIANYFEENKAKFQEYQDLCNNTDYSSFIHLCILGRPNVGKSTLFNAIVGEERSIVGDKSGITRDAIATHVKFYERDIKLIDTAGIKKSFKADALEKASNLETMRALRLTHIAIVVIDATAGLINQDLQIISQATSEGRPVIIAINKIDAVKEEKAKVLSQIQKAIDGAFLNIANPIMIEISAKDGKNIGGIYKKVISTYDSWNTKVQTSALNQWLKQRVLLHKPPKFKGRDVKLKYITQTKIRPPTFVIFGNTKDIPESYMRYLMNSLSQDFGLNSVPIRFKIETSQNPFNKSKE